MRAKPWAATYECGQQLVAAGCPLPYLDHLPRSSRKGPRFSVSEVGGYAQNVLYDFGGNQLIVIALVVRSERHSGTVIADWTVTFPWKIYVDWAYDPCDAVPKRDLPAYDGLFGSRLRAVLDEKRLISRGHPVKGLICGRAWIEDFPPAEQSIKVNVTLTDDAGFTKRLRTSVRIDRSLAYRRPPSTVSRRKPLLASPDPPDAGNWRNINYHVNKERSSSEKLLPVVASKV